MKQLTVGELEKIIEFYKSKGFITVNTPIYFGIDSELYGLRPADNAKPVLPNEYVIPRKGFIIY